MPDVFEKEEVDELISKIESVFTTSDSASESGEPQKWIRNQTGKIYAARNLHELINDFDDTWQRPELIDLVSAVLGKDCGLVRALYFDKHPERTWSLPWHRDMTIVVENNNLPSKDFIKPTIKAGIPHIEAPVRLLENMLTLRIHLDPVSVDNGPLIVKPKSHRLECTEFDDDRMITSNAGDIFAMRPLIFHSSPSSKPGTKIHRRIIHLEFSARKDLWDGFKWRTFIPCPRSHR